MAADGLIFAKERQKRKNLILISPASSDENRIGAYFLRLASIEIIDFLFGLGNPTRTIKAVAKFFERKSNEFSFEFVDFARINGRPVGALLSYPAKIGKDFVLPMIFQSFGVYSPLELPRFFWRVLPVSNINEQMAEDHQYYISYLAVLPDFQNQGIGTCLMEYAERKAIASGFSECAICVLFENERARRLYERLGYEIVGIIESRYLKTHLEIKGICRMVKRLTRITVPTIQGVSLEEPEFLPA
ncbi:MAG: hypothetical protein COX90_00885 [Candidatus Nealsonbacteria bacterium CG_4_10_14_0_2_um_filter_38_17]|uniref:N-acetyltransferase domain-containing protein n=2 Tax=Candidatus Nealsoniibacteriota TaxID=1817911 RepID=A0A2M7UYR3_9BACT|nr:MAG: hypothetical protein COX36_00195 [Candidatus Nealsonbacteria bacterium CG23_combo_of_CG06-09_8_20_14_all_38_19]PIZ89113.1 MAG: hypothetical protein COX90_00885 [Candidatus Nealsonbacteria bacterium CG_4_10_14_0_2_um_filter_38_17]